ncbi:sulfatase-like hydrolase/transferase [Rhodopirellula sp. P2]|uniref:sulfatase-like hydrolase/transferase n=1 Tax=Rhodopirellula sp. P2 TaxID=2127060 RepID=UPI0023682A4D|nr:sulfatase-like hydrolase/transferase [Rhodopirellula sp. P2]WDQ17818.1 sulfatase-like hydrolase/transferase [Rhodopirellula sp. P2]
MMYRPLSTLLLWMLLALPHAFAESSQPPAKPNVLFIAMDDLNDWIGCLGGHPQTITPNLDRLAASGILFSNAHCPAPACNPCRSAVFTGRSPHQSGLYDNRQQMREIMPDEVILPQYFRNHGYHAAGSGKLLHYFIDADSWDEYFPKAESENPLPQTFYPTQRPVSLKRGGPWQYVETDWAALDVTDEEFGGDWAVSQWIGDQLRAEHDQPFFLGCGIYRPHEPWFVPQKYFEPFPLESIQLPPGYLENDLDDVPAAGQRAARNRYFAHIQEQDQWKQGIQGYLASIHFADAMLGRVLDALESGPNANNTIVVLWSDHGWQLGEKEHWQKYTPWRAVTRVPLMVRVPQSLSPSLPEGTPSGVVCDAPVNTLSLFPTLLDLCELPSRPQNDGPSLLPLLHDPDSQDWTQNSVTYLSQPGGYAISGRTHRYVHYPDGSEELYDIQADPYEWENLANQATAISQLTHFRSIAPTEFAKRIEPSVKSLAKLSFHPIDDGAAPPSKPAGNKFPVHFLNQQRDPVELCWMDEEANPKPYGTIQPGQTQTQSTRPGAVWMVREPATGKPLGYFRVGDRTAQAVIPATKPNVVIILTDDQGWADLSCQDVVDDIQTPHIDALAARGVRCTNAYVTSPQCSPSRAGLITGRYQQRFGIDTIPDMPLPTEAVTMAEHLQPLGYRTGFVGKWHLEPNVTCVDWIRRELPAMADKPRRQVRIPWPKIQPYSPAQQGFDEYYWGAMTNYRTNFDLASGELLPQMKQLRDERFRIDVQSDAAVNFIDRNHDQPFYLQLNYYGPHTPLEATDEYLDRFPQSMPKRRRYALAMLAAIDDGVGRIVDQLKTHGLLDNTLVVMTSDNGAPLKMTKVDTPIDGDAGGWDGSLNDPWVGEKGMLSEGGIRVPMIWSLPSQLPSAITYNWPISTLDIAPSVLQLAGGTLDPESEPFDGINLIPRLNDIQIPSTRTLYFRFWDQAAVRQGKWKYIFVGDGRRYLFDLESDQHEHRNLIESYPELAGKLHETLQTWTLELDPPGLPKGKKMRERDWYDFYFDDHPLSKSK